MSDPPPDTNDTGAGSRREPVPSTPRWVKILGIVALVVAALVVILMLVGGHGPGRHMADIVGNGTSSAHIIEYGAHLP